MLSGHKRSRQRGFSIIESLVGITIGLFVVTGALVLTSSMTFNNRNLIVETRLIQDLRASSELVTRDLRRAGYWEKATSGVYFPGNNAAIPRNAYQNIIADGCDAATLPTPVPIPDPDDLTSAVCYYIEQGTSNNTVSDAEMFGFKLSSGILYAFIAGKTPQPLSDPNSVNITQFNLNPIGFSIPLSSNCATTPTPGNEPTVVVREFEIEIRGNPPSDTSMVRAVRTKVRVRNDHISGSCS